MEKYVNFEKKKTLSYIKSYKKFSCKQELAFWAVWKRHILQNCRGNAICIYRLHDVCKESRDTVRYSWMHRNSDIQDIMEILETAGKTSRQEWRRRSSRSLGQYYTWYNGKLSNRGISNGENNPLQKRWQFNDGVYSCAETNLTTFGTSVAILFGLT